MGSRLLVAATLPAGGGVRHGANYDDEAPGPILSGPDANPRAPQDDPWIVTSTSRPA